MPKLKWDQTGERFYETGVDHCALYVYDSTANEYGTGVAWNGITAITESPSGAEANPIYADNMKYLNLMSNEDFGATVEAYTYPDEFEACNGAGEFAAGVVIGQQDRKMFGLAYRTRVGNDVDGDALGYKLHIIYGAKAAPSEKQYNTVNDSPEAAAFSWELSTTPVNVDVAGKNFKPTAHIEIDSTKISESGMTSAMFQAIEESLFGGDGDEKTAKLLMPNEIYAILHPAG